MEIAAVENIVSYFLLGFIWISLIPFGKLLSRLAGESYAHDVFNGEMMSEVTVILCIFSFICFLIVFAIPIAAVSSILELEFPVLLIALACIGVIGFSTTLCSAFIRHAAKKKYKELQEQDKSKVKALDYVRSMIKMMNEEKHQEDEKVPVRRRGILQ